ncbi:MAG TPA: M14 metallopeptidase family protein [Blastocatellia bacterium]|nr:M14 metallopeptidase family protein [Blastocatellia bacterium]
MLSRRVRTSVGILTALSAIILLSQLSAFAGADGIPTPEAFLGFRVGEDKKLARWEKIVEYMRIVANGSDRVRFRELGKTSNNNPFILLEIGSADTIKNLDRYKQLERRLYFQGGAPSDSERDEIFRSGKAVVLVTCNIHSTEIGSSQMVLELVHRLATEDSAVVKKILDNVIFLLVPSLNPDGQIMVTDWYNKNVGTEFEASPLPWLYHPYIGHDNNRDMYMFTQKESQLTARLLWHDWFPSVWLDEHQMGSNGARIFVMPATDPINQNVHPLIYRWNGILGQAQAAALESAGKEGIIYNSTYTNFWQGAMAWSGWWHNQVGLLTEVASARVASPIEQRRAQPGQQPQAAAAEDFQGQQRRQMENPNEPLPPPRDVTPRTEYPRPWMGGKWTLRDIVDYELIATMALLETAADQREALLKQIYEVNRATVEAGAKGDPAAIVIPTDRQHDPREAYHLVERLQMAGVEVSRADGEFEADGKKYSSGTFVIPMNQVFARYAKDLLEKQTYPEVRRSPASPPEPPYDVTAWSLGMQMGVETRFLKKALPPGAKLTRLDADPKPVGEVKGDGSKFSFDYSGADSAIAVNRLLKAGVQTDIVLLSASEKPRVSGIGASRELLQSLSRDLGLVIQRAAASNAKPGKATNPTDKMLPLSTLRLRAPRIGLYQSWTGNMDEGWTRWVLEQYEFPYTTLHNADIKAGKLREKFDAIVLPDQQPRDILNGYDFKSVRQEYRGGIGDEGIEALREFVRSGGTLIAMGASCDLAIDKFPIPVRNLKRGLSRDQHFAPGTIVRIQVDNTNPVGFGMPAETYGFYNNSPFFALVEGFSSQKASVIARYPNSDIVASGWLKGEELMAGRAAVVSIEMNPGRIVLFGLRPQHRAQTHATFQVLFGAIYCGAFQRTGEQ